MFLRLKRLDDNVEINLIVNNILCFGIHDEKTVVQLVDGSIIKVAESCRTIRHQLTKLMEQADAKAGLEVAGAAG